MDIVMTDIKSLKNDWKQVDIRTFYWQKESEIDQMNPGDDVPEPYVINGKGFVTIVKNDQEQSSLSKSIVAILEKYKIKTNNRQTGDATIQGFTGYQRDNEVCVIETKYINPGKLDESEIAILCGVKPNLK
jgi:hypothetical protein